jgi:hypothetical protein
LKGADRVAGLGHSRFIEGAGDPEINQVCEIVAVEQDVGLGQMSSELVRLADRAFGIPHAAGNGCGSTAASSISNAIVIVTVQANAGMQHWFRLCAATNFGLPVHPDCTQAINLARPSVTTPLTSRTGAGTSPPG